MPVTGRTKAKPVGRGHYVMDLFYPDAAARDGFRRDVLRIDAAGDEAAMAECARINGWRQPSFYRIRAIRSTTRSGDMVIFDSQAASAGAAPDAVIEMGAGAETAEPQSEFAASGPEAQPDEMR